MLPQYVQQITFKIFSATSASNGSLLKWKIALFLKNFFVKSTSALNQAIEKMPISDFQSQFSTSQKLSVSCSIYFPLKNIYWGAYFLLTTLFWKLQFLKHFIYYKIMVIFWSFDLEWKLIYQKFFYRPYLHNLFA